MNRLSVFRKSLGLTQLRLADKLSMTQSRVCEIEREVVVPWEEEVAMIAEHFGVKPAEVFPEGWKVRQHYESEEASPPTRYYDICPKCGAQAIYCSCYACGKSLEEVTNV
jgi:transcriptional regulator with XRE-family HTH domain